MENNIFVTGGSGFIGSALCRRLLEKGYSVTSFDNNFRNTNLYQTKNENLKIVNGDIRNKAEVMSAAKGCDTMFHLAFINGTENFYKNPKLVLDVGINGMMSVLNILDNIEFKTFILASSSEIYQAPTIIPTPEEERAIIPNVKNPRFSYSAGKLISEILTFNYLRDEPIREMVFRPHNVFGPNMGFEHVIPQIMMKLQQSTKNWQLKKASIQIQGTGDETRAFCYVSDAVDQIITIFERGKKGELYNIGDQNEISIKSLIEMIGQILNVSIEVSPGSKLEGSTTRRCPDIKKIQSLGYHNISSFQRGLEKTVRWYRDTLSEQSL